MYSASLNNYQVNGAFAGQSAISLDGQPLNTGFWNYASLIPTQDSIAEFKVQTNNLGPEWSRFAGGVMTLVTKSGTNDLHGGAYEYLRNRVLNANTFFSNRAGIKRPAFTQNQFGAFAGGPLYIPHVYDGRNKTFWFFSGEGIRLRQGADVYRHGSDRGPEAGRLLQDPKLKWQYGHHLRPAHRLRTAGKRIVRHAKQRPSLALSW